MSMNKEEIKEKIVEAINNASIDTTEVVYSFYTIYKDGEYGLEKRTVRINLQNGDYDFRSIFYPSLKVPSQSDEESDREREERIYVDLFFRNIETYGGFETAQEAIESFREQERKDTKSYLISEVAMW